jgi:hypothetical protein
VWRVTPTDEPAAHPTHPLLSAPHPALEPPTRKANHPADPERGHARVMGGPPIHRLLRHLEPTAPPAWRSGSQSQGGSSQVPLPRPDVYAQGRLGAEPALALTNSRANRATGCPGGLQHLAGSYGRPGSGLLWEEVSPWLPRAAKCSAVRRNQAATAPATTTWSNAAGSLNLRSPSQIEGGQVPRSRIARSATTVRAVGRGTASKPVTARERLRRSEGHSQRGRDGTVLLEP